MGSSQGAAAVDLLAQARAAGLGVSVAGERLIIRGPAAAEHLARALLDRKADVLAELTVEKCDRILDDALPALTPPQRAVAEVYRGLCRRYAEGADSLLWTMPDFLREEIARWKRT